MKKFLIPLVTVAAVAAIFLAGCMPGAAPVTPPAGPAAPEPVPGPATAADIPELAAMVARGQVDGSLKWNPFARLLVKPDGTSFKVAYTVSTLEVEPCAQSTKMMEDYFPRCGMGQKGVNWTTFGARFDVDAQIGFMEDMAATMHPDWFQVHSVSAELQVPVTEKMVNELHIPVFTQDCGISTDAVTSFVAHKFEGPGGTDILGAWLINALEERGYGPDNPCVIAEEWGMREMLTSKLRHEGFHKAIDPVTWITVIETEDTDWAEAKTATITADTIMAHPEVVALFHHGCGGQGMVPGLESIDMLLPLDDPDHIIIASNDAENAMWDNVLAGKADTFSTHGMVEPSDICFQVAVTSVVFGQPVEKFYQCPFLMVDASNINTVQIGGVPPSCGMPRGRWDLWVPMNPLPEYGFPQPSLALRMQYMGY